MNIVSFCLTQECRLEAGTFRFMPSLEVKEAN